MNEKIKIINIRKEESKCVFIIEDTFQLTDFSATGQMLVDSDGFAFIYLIEVNDAYKHLVIEDKYWHELVGENQAFYLENKDGSLLLVDFHEELEYLVDNIQGNSNYGEEMVNKVEQIFFHHE